MIRKLSVIVLVLSLAGLLLGLLHQQMAMVLPAILLLCLSGGWLAWQWVQSSNAESGAADDDESLEEEISLGQLARGTAALVLTTVAIEETAIGVADSRLDRVILDDLADGGLSDDGTGVKQKSGNKASRSTLESSPPPHGNDASGSMTD